MLHEATRKGVDINRKKIRIKIIVYSLTKAYLDLLCEGGARFDLRCQENSEVSEEQRNHALKKRKRTNLLSKTK